MPRRSSSSKRLLVVSPHWLPVNAPDLQRARTSLLAYRAHGWEPTILAVRPEDIDTATLDPALAATVPADIRVERVATLPLAWTRRFGLRSLALRAAPALYQRGRALLARERFDLVLMTHTQFAIMPLARLWRAEFGVPFVVDLQDPWRTDYYEQPGRPRPPGGWKYQLARLQARLLEEWSYRAGAGFMSVSPAHLAQLAQRYPWARTTPSAVIPFGASPADLDVALTAPSTPSPRAPTAAVPCDAGGVRLVSIGAAGPIMRHSLETLFAALAAFRAANPGRAARLRLQFVGTSYAPSADARPSVRPIAEAFGVCDLVDEQPARIGLLESLRAQARADAILILGSDDPAYTPSKLPGAALTGRPLLVIAPAVSRLATLVADWNGVTFAANDAPTRIDTPLGPNAPRGHDAPRGADAIAVIGGFFARALAGFSSADGVARGHVAPLLADALGARQCALFAEACAHHARHANAHRIV